MKFLFLWLSVFCSATALAETFEIAPGTKVTVVLHEEAKEENTIEFLRDGKVIQTEKSLGDRFAPFTHKGKENAVHALDVDHDGTQEIFVRLLMVPMGVVRVFHWNKATNKFDRMKFGAKKEDGLPVPPNRKVTLLENGNIQFMGGPKKTAKPHALIWDGHDYLFPARAVRTP